MSELNIVTTEDLKNDDKISEIVLEISNNGARYVLTRNGVEVGVIGPYEVKKDDKSVMTKSEMETALKDIESLAKEISKQWKGSENSLETVQQIRRQL